MKRKLIALASTAALAGVATVAFGQSASSHSAPIPCTALGAPILDSHSPLGQTRWLLACDTPRDGDIHNIERRTAPIAPAGSFVYYPDETSGSPTLIEAFVPCDGTAICLASGYTVGVGVDKEHSHMIFAVDANDCRQWRKDAKGDLHYEGRQSESCRPVVAAFLRNEGLGVQWLEDGQLTLPESSPLKPVAFGDSQPQPTDACSPYLSYRATYRIGEADCGVMSHIHRIPTPLWWKVYKKPDDHFAI